MKVLALLLLFLLFSLSSGITTPPPEGVLNAAETLSSSGYNAMSLTLQLILSSVEFPKGGGRGTHTTLTIFTPPDSSFEAKGQPSLARLLLHFSPLSLSLSSLASLPFGTRLPTLSPSQAPLFVTSPSPSRLSINNVNVKANPIFDDGSLIVFAVDDFFDTNFTLQDHDPSPPPPLPQCRDVSGLSTFSEAAVRLKGRGYSVMASFLELQLLGYLKLGTSVLELTMFASEDEASWCCSCRSGEEMVVLGEWGGARSGRGGGGWCCCGKMGWGLLLQIRWRGRCCNTGEVGADPVQ